MSAFLHANNLSISSNQILPRANECPIKISTDCNCPLLFQLRGYVSIYHNKLFRLLRTFLVEIEKLNRLFRLVGDRGVSVGVAVGGGVLGVLGGTGGEVWSSSSSGIMRRLVTAVRHSVHSSKGWLRRSLDM
jgi:hypothetical protein